MRIHYRRQVHLPGINLFFDYWSHSAKICQIFALWLP